MRIFNLDGCIQPGVDVEVFIPGPPGPRGPTGGTSLIPTTVDDDYIVQPDDQFLIVTDNSDITMPDAVANAEMYLLIKIYGAAAVNILPHAAGQLFDNKTSLNISANFTEFALYAYGGNWLIC